MSPLNWKGKRMTPVGGTGFIRVYKPSINELMKPLSMKAGLGSAILSGNIINPQNEPSASPAVTPTPSITPTETLTPTVTATVTLTPTISETPTLTPTETLTPTPSLTPEVTPSPTPSITPTITLTPSITPSASPLPIDCVWNNTDENWNNNNNEWNECQNVSGDTDANTYLSAVTSAGGTGLTSTISAATVTLFSDLKLNGLYSKITAMYPFLGGVSASCKWNAKDPTDSNAAYRLTFNGGWTFDASGATPNASNAYANPHLSGSTLDRYSAHASYYSQTTSRGIEIEIGANSGTGVSIISWRLAADTFLFGTDYREYNINSQGSSFGSISNTATTGYFVSSRISDTSSSIYRNSVLNDSNAGTTNGVVNFSLYIGANNNEGVADNYSSKKTGFVTFGTGLTSSEVVTLSNIVNNWARSIGRNTY